MRRAGLFALLLSPCLVLGMGSAPQKPVAAAPGKPGVMLRDDAMKAAASAAAPSLATLSRGTKVRILASEGGWTQVYSGGTSGWVRILSVKTDAGTTLDTGALIEVGSRPSEPGKVVAVAGARGLDEEQLRGASFSTGELALLDTHAIGAAAAEQFSLQAGLIRRVVPYLPEPERRANSMSNEP